MASSEFFFPSNCGWRLGPFSFPQKKSAFYHSLFVARLRKLANPTPPKKTLGEAQAFILLARFCQKVK
jgi:hypothetical protein